MQSRDQGKLDLFDYFLNASTGTTKFVSDLPCCYAAAVAVSLCRRTIDSCPVRVKMNLVNRHDSAEYWQAGLDWPLDAFSDITECECTTFQLIHVMESSRCAVEILVQGHPFLLSLMLWSFVLRHVLALRHEERERRVSTWKDHVTVSFAR
jgi:hypothetical protein